MSDSQLLHLWSPSKDRIVQSNMYHYMQWLEINKNYSFESYNSLWEWSVKNLKEFWETQWDYFDIQTNSSYNNALNTKSIYNTDWFQGARLNYTEHIFRNLRPKETAIISKSELRPIERMRWNTLYEKVASFAKGLKDLGIKSGDRVVAYLPNITETTVAFLACASIGAVWSSCSPDFGNKTVIARFKQIEPKLLITVDGYRYNGKDYDRLSIVEKIQKSISTIENTILIPYLSYHPNTDKLINIELWEDFIYNHKTSYLNYTYVSFNHPLWILYSSGTTGKPKAIVQGHGGILLEHLKKLSIHTDLKPDDNFFWFTTTGWMMWNIVVSGLLTGATIVLYDGSPIYPSADTLWDFADKTGITVFGTSATYLMANKSKEIKPGEKFKLRKLKSIVSTGSPLPPEGFIWVYENIKNNLWLYSISGGTDVCTSFVGGSPLLPVYAGEIQCRLLGSKVQAYSEKGNEVFNQVGELVVSQPMPSMPLYFWGDFNNERYYNSYFNHFSGVWRHGDWIKIKPNGTCQIYGRSDSTINRGGIRIGTIEIYSAIEELEKIEDSLVVDLSESGGEGYVPLFVTLKKGEKLNKHLENEIKENIRKNCSPRHVPDDVFEIPEVPYTLNGKKMEIPIKNILMGSPIEKAINKDSMKNPEALEYFINIRKGFE